MQLAMKDYNDLVTVQEVKGEAGYTNNVSVATR